MQYIPEYNKANPEVGLFFKGIMNSKEGNL